MSREAIKGEDSLVQEFLAPLAAGYPGAFGLRDDCATVAPEQGHELVIKTDPIVEGVHFLPGSDAEDIAWRALAVNVSDIAAKGAVPVAYVMALALPEAPTRGWMDRFAAGLAKAQAAFGCHLIGGDTDRTPGPLTISITCLGSVPLGRMVRRGTARAGDQLFVTGTLGDAALGLALSKDAELRRDLGLSEEEEAFAVDRFRRPQPRLPLAPLLRNYASAAMDLSDGLAKDCGRMCAASGLGARVRAGALPLSASVRKALSREPGWLERTLTHGDDYEILAAVPAVRAADFVAEARNLPFSTTLIGELMPGQGVAIERPDGALLELDSTGWDHFA